jgi:predicted nucleic acid-binding protein
LTELRKSLVGHQRIAIDTNIFVYLLQHSERYTEMAEAVFAWVKQPGHSAVVSTIVLTELLVPLYRQAGSIGHFLTGKLSSLDVLPYRAAGEESSSGLLMLLATYANLEWIAADFGIADLAAQYRARYRLKTPDALHAATAVHSGATGFVTNDASFNRVEEFETLQFETLR